MNDYRPRMIPREGHLSNSHGQLKHLAKLRRSTLPQFNAVVRAHNAVRAAEAALADAVLAARIAGVTWAQIGDVLSLTASGARERFPLIRGSFGGPGPLRIAVPERAAEVEA